MSLLDSVEEALKATGVIRLPGATLLVAVSGGPDSVALLSLLHELAQRNAFHIHAAHLDHGLRGTESDEDARHVQEVCLRLGVPVATEKADVAALRARYRLSWEAAARQARYDFLARVSRTVGATVVALGHTADDQAETVLLHLLRGTGIRGLRGMLPLSRWRSRDGASEVALVRPLLGVARQETEAYCASHGLAPRYDSSNLEERFTRNRIRRNLMPQLRRYNPAVTQALVRLAGTVAQDVAYIDQQVQAAWPSIAIREPWGVRLDRHAFNELHPGLQAHALQRAYAEVAGESLDLNLAQIQGMRRMAEQGAGRALSLGHGLRFFTTYQELVVSRKAQDSPWPELEPLELPDSPGEVCAKGWRISLRRLAVSEMATEQLGNDPFRAYLSGDAVGGNALVRIRKPGDSFQPLGMKGSKKLKDFMIDAHIPRLWRDGVPLVVTEEGIAWVVGWRIAHWARVTPETEEVVEITFFREDRQN
ncbi:MAG: tRNA lysidine(34) synthetase TilS [Dehalococcoidia bacterium]|nr:tRNA lysidine(34) synthetase TilS [Dehalococcoidia bacterium]